MFIEISVWCARIGCFHGTENSSCFYYHSLLHLHRIYHVLSFSNESDFEHVQSFHSVKACSYEVKTLPYLPINISSQYAGLYSTLFVMF